MIMKLDMQIYVIFFFFVFEFRFIFKIVYLIFILNFEKNIVQRMCIRVYMINKRFTSTKENNINFYTH